MKDHIIICGLGHVGFRTCQLLLRMQKNVVVISDFIHPEWRTQLENRCLLIEGDARNDKILIKAAIRQAQCILALTDRDLVNVSIVMDARKLNPTIKIIARMFDTELGTHIAEAFQVHQVFSTYELGAPMFSSGIHEKTALAQFSLDKKKYIVAEKNNVSPDIQAFPLAELPDTKDTLIYTPVKPSLHATPPGRIHHYIDVISKAIRYFRSPVLNNFRRFLGVLFCVIIFSTLFLEASTHLSLLNAFYFVITTVTTVGYGDINFLNATPLVKIFGCLLMLTGAASLAILFSSITEIILSKKLETLFGSRLVPKRDHVIVVGESHLSQRVIMNLLEENIPVVALEDTATKQYSMDLKQQLAVVEGEPRSTDTLKRAGVLTANALITLTDDDVQNLGVSLAAKKLNPNLLTITQIFEFNLATKLQDDMSINRVLSMSAVAAPYFAAAVFGEKILLALIWKEHLVYLSEDGETAPQNKRLALDDKVSIHLVPLL